MKINFNTFYWGKNTEVKFEPFTDIPKDIPVTACMIMALLDNKYLVLSSPKRGWGLPGGHTEKEETPQETAIRELFEETAVQIDPKSLQVVGGWLAKKINKTPKNEKYPDLAYMLLFTANIKKINQFSKAFETYDRIFVPISQVTRYTGGENFIQIFNYLTETYKNRFVKAPQENKVSIIIPFYNTEKYIKKCLDSVAKQSFQNIEVLLINDGSTDSSEEICKNYTKLDNRFKLIKHRKNRGLPTARNTGLDFVTGNYICFIDSDDYIHEDFVSKLLTTALQNKADIVECLNYCLIDGKLAEKHSLNEYANNKTVSSGKEVLRNYLRHSKPRTSTVSLCNKIYTTYLFKNNHISFDSNLTKFEDSDTIYKLYAKTKKHVFIPDKLYFHVHRKGSIMRPLVNKNDSFESTLYVLTKMLAYFSDNKVHKADAMMYLRWNLTHTLQGLSDDNLAIFFEENIVKQSKDLETLYKNTKELLVID